MKKLVLTTLLAVVTASPAIAETGRYILERTDNGYVRMDTQTGDIALCGEEEGQIICRAAADERAAFQQQLDALEQRIDLLEQALGSGARVLPGEPSDGLPSPDEFERGLDYMERFLDRFRGIIEDFEEPRENRT